MSLRWLVGAWLGLIALQAQPKPVVIVVVGPPGSGKTVQAQRLAKKYRVPSFSMADLLQEEMGKKSALGTAVQASIASGELLGDAAANELMSTRLLRGDVGRGCILDGYPSTEGQAKYFDQMLQEKELPRPKVVLLDAPDEIVRKRLLARKRVDDQPANIERRLKEYHEEAAVLQQWYQQENVLKVDATQPVETVARQIDAVLVEAVEKRGFAVREK